MNEYINNINDKTTRLQNSLERVEIMPRTEREPGTADEVRNLMGGVAALGLGSVAAPGLMMGLANPAVGKGLGGIAASVVANTETTEAGIFAGVKNLLGHNNVVPKILKRNGNWVIGAGDEVFEINTAGMANAIRKNKGKIDSKTLKSVIADFDWKTASARGMNAETGMSVHAITKSIKDAPISEKNMFKPTGRMDVTRAIGGWNNGMESIINSGRSLWDKAKITAHEVNHQGQHSGYTKAGRDIADPAYRGSTAYSNRSFEIEARQAQRRVNLSKELTNPNHKYGVHPDLDYVNGKFQVSKDVYGRYVNTKQMSDPGLKRFENLYNEAERLNKILKKDIKFKGLVDDGYGKNMSLKDKYYSLDTALDAGLYGGVAAATGFTANAVKENFFPEETITMKRLKALGKIK